MKNGFATIKKLEKDNNPIERRCVYCGKVFFYLVGKDGQFMDYCSHDCKEGFIGDLYDENDEYYEDERSRLYRQVESWGI